MAVGLEKGLIHLDEEEGWALRAPSQCTTPERDG